MRTKNIARAVVMALTGFVLLVAFAVPSQAAVGDTGTTVVGGGSDVLWRLGNQLDDMYNESPGCELVVATGTQPLDYKCLADTADTVLSENYYHDEPYSKYALGGGAGVNEICQRGQAGVAPLDYARQTSAPTSANCHGLNYVAFARDGLTWEAFPGLPGSPAASMNDNAGPCKHGTTTKKGNGFCLSIQQLKNIFVNCTITNWNQIGGPNHAISIYTAAPQFGTRKQWDTFLGGSSASCIPAGQLATHQTVETFNPYIVKQADAPYAISLASTASWTARMKPFNDGSKLGAVEGIVPSAKTIGDGTFPFSRFMFNVYSTSDCACGASSAATVRYVGEHGWICKPSTEHAVEPFSGQNYRTVIANKITALGFVPLTSGPIGGGAVGSDYCRLFQTP